MSKKSKLILILVTVLSSIGSQFWFSPLIILAGSPFFYFYPIKERKEIIKPAIIIFIIIIFSAAAAIIPFILTCSVIFFSKEIKGAWKDKETRNSILKGVFSLWAKAMLDQAKRSEERSQQLNSSNNSSKRKSQGMQYQIRVHPPQEQSYTVVVRAAGGTDAVKIVARREDLPLNLCQLEKSGYDLE